MFKKNYYQEIVDNKLILEDKITNTRSFLSQIKYPDENSQYYITMYNKLIVPENYDSKLNEIKDYLKKNIFQYLNGKSPTQQLKEIENQYVLGHKDDKNYYATIKDKKYNNLEPIPKFPQLKNSKEKKSKVKHDGLGYFSYYKPGDIKNAYNNEVFDETFTIGDLYFLKLPSELIKNEFGESIKNLKALEILFEDENHLKLINNEILDKIKLVDNIYQELVIFKNKIENEDAALEEMDDIHSRLTKFTNDIYDI